jgi:DNA-binding SARP family transcriptional activator
MLRPVAAMTRDIGIRVLGPVQVRANGGWLSASPQQRLLLALLVLQAGHVIPVADLIDVLWPDAPPTSARASIQVMVSRLRQILAGVPDASVERCGDAYRLLIAPCSTDVEQFRLFARAARDAADAAEALSTFDQALALWRGPALADVPDSARIEAIRFSLAEERLSAMQDRIGALLTIGLASQAAEELTGLVAAHPLAERLAGLLMLALYRCGRQADALQVFRDLRERLSGELAIEPGRDLQYLHQQILAGNIALSTAVSPSTGSGELLPGVHELTAARDDPQSIPRQLPAGVAHFVGRAADLRALDSLLTRLGSADGSVPISAISGTAGVGKTALALHWAHQRAHDFPDGQLYVNLGAFGPSRVPVRAADAIGGFLDALGVPTARRPAGVEVLAALYRSVLADKQMLVILDNADDEEQVRPLLPGADRCLVLVTSRRRLAGLAASEGAHLITLDVLSQPEALDLLAKRLGTDVTAIAPEAVTQLATLCGRLPLALSVAAVRVAESPDLDLAALTARMQDVRNRLDLLDLGERAGNVRTVFSWSYTNLSRPAARMFRLFAVHPGPDIGLGAAASLLGCPVGQARRILAELTGAHMVTEHRLDRWLLHGLLRAYANERARSDEDRTESDAAMQRALDYYVQTARSAAVLLSPGREPAFVLSPPSVGVEPDCIDSADEATAWYDAEQQVLVEVISWAAAAGFDMHAWQLACELADFFAMRARWREALAQAQQVLRLARASGHRGQEATAVKKRMARLALRAECAS